MSGRMPFEYFVVHQHLKINIWKGTRFTWELNNGTFYVNEVRFQCWKDLWETLVDRSDTNALEGVCEAQQEGKEGAMGLTLGWLRITHIKPFTNKLVNDKVYLVARWCTTNYQREHPREHTRTRLTAKQTGVRVQQVTVSQAIRSRGRKL